MFQQRTHGSLTDPSYLPSTHQSHLGSRDIHRGVPRCIATSALLKPRSVRTLSRNPSVGQPEKKQGDSSYVTAKPSLKLTASLHLNFGGPHRQRRFRAWKPPFFWGGSDSFREGTFPFLETKWATVDLGIQSEERTC